MSFAACSAILRHAQVPWRADFRAGARDAIRLVAYVHRVDGVAPGAYLLDRQAATLRPLQDGDQRAWARSLSLGQEIGADSLMAFSMLGDFEGALAAFGDRGYRYLHFEAGFVGQNLYLGAEAAGFNATGIGAFFDDEVHRHLGMEPAHGQVIYHFSIGRAVFDPRIVQTATEPLQLEGA
jgi:SagB-type dehydrogenase family enzyme